MWHIGIDLHRQSLTIAAVSDSGETRLPERLDCSNTEAIQQFFHNLQPFRAVIEATGTYRWLYKLLAPMGTVLLAHPLRLRAMIIRRSKSDRLDAKLLAELLRMNQIPLSYIPSDSLQQLRDVIRYRTSLSRQIAHCKLRIRQVLARENINPPYKYPFGPRGLYWISRQDFGVVGNQIRDHALEQLRWTSQQATSVDAKLKELEKDYPQAQVLMELKGIGLFSALLIIAEFGDVSRFHHAKQAAAYTGLTTRMFQSADKCRSGHISKQGSPWLRWILVEAAIKLIPADKALQNFYQRIRKRAGNKIARVAAARKLAEICYKRLLRFQRQQQAVAA